ncbi:MAG: methyltransferase [Bdellovibrionales bacterium]|nr:methyltransferase [Bdellovibrionales bacterium]
MSTINPHYTFEYSQPDEYRFSHDSVFMAREIFERYREQDLSGFDILDLCSGCGIIGLDLLFHLRKENRALPRSIDFVEVQETYREHFIENLRRCGNTTSSLRFLCQNYEALLNSPKKYDLIVCNPPYFQVHQGKLSPSEFKNRCRFFIDSSLEVLLQVLETILKPNGAAYFLFRETSKLKIMDLQKLINFSIHKAGVIRGTDLLKISP